MREADARNEPFIFPLPPPFSLGEHHSFGNESSSRDRNDVNRPLAKGKCSRSPTAAQELPRDSPMVMAPSPTVQATQGSTDALELTQTAMALPTLKHKQSNNIHTTERKPSSLLYNRPKWFLVNIY